MIWPLMITSVGETSSANVSLKQGCGGVHTHRPAMPMELRSTEFHFMDFSFGTEADRSKLETPLSIDQARARP